MSLLLSLFVSLLSLQAESPPVGEGKSRLPDPFPIRRVLLSNQAPIPRFEGNAGPFRQMTQLEFESLVQSAARMQTERKSPPRISSASYHARLVGNDIIGEWDWIIQGKQAGICILDPLGVALRKIDWNNGKPAMLFRHDSSLALWVDQPSPARVHAQWSFRGTPEPDSVRFDLSLPSVPIAELELELEPEKQPVSHSPDTLITGPFPGAEGKKLWRFAIGGQSRIPFSIRTRSNNPAQSTYIKSSRVARWNCQPGLAQVRYELDLETLRSPLDQWQFQFDTRLRIVEVSANNLESWRVESVPSSENLMTMVLQLRRPTSSLRVSVTGYGKPPLQQQWRFPTLTPLPGIVSEDTVQVNLTHDMTLLGWDPGDFRLSSSSDTQQGQSLLFEGTLVANPGIVARRMPAMRVSPVANAFTTQEQLDWWVSPEQTRLEAKLKIQVVQGPLSRIEIECPPNYEPKIPNLTPADSALQWYKGKGNRWIIEPSQAIPSGQSMSLDWELIGPPPNPSTNPTSLAPTYTRMTFPQWNPIGASARDGNFSIHVADELRAWVTQRSGLPVNTEVRPIVFRIDGAQTDGELMVSPRRPQASPRLESRLRIEHGRLHFVHRFPLPPTLRHYSQLSLWVPDRDGLIWDGLPESNESVRVRRSPLGNALTQLTLFGCSDPLTSLLPLRNPGHLWAITWNALIPTDPVITLHGSRPLVEDRRIELPLPTILGVDRAAVAIQLDPSVAAQFEIEQDSPSIVLRPRDLPAKNVTRPAWRLVDLLRTTRVERDFLLCQLRGRVLEGSGALTIHLPGEARIETVNINGRWQDPPRQSHTEDRLLVELPISGWEEEGTPFEIQYRLPLSAPWLACTISSPDPLIAGDAMSMIHEWIASPLYRLLPRFEKKKTTSDIDEMGIIRSDKIPYLGAAVFLLALTLCTLTRYHFVRILACLIILVGFVFPLLPEGWSEQFRLHLWGFLLLMPVLGYLRLKSTPVKSPTPTPPPATTAPKVAATLVVLLGIGATTWSAEAEILPVYFAPEGASFYAFVPEKLLDQLKAAREPEQPGVIIRSIDYSAREREGQLEVEAQFRLHVTRPGNHVFALPLTGIKLESMLLDSELAFPELLTPDQYTIQLSREGEHTLQARFQVAINSSGADRDARFVGPECSITRLKIELAAMSRNISLPGRRGAIVSTGTRMQAKQYEIDLGQIGTVILRWREGQVEAGSTRFSVTAAGIWDISESEATLSAAYHYQIQSGLLNSLAFELPANLEPGLVQVYPLDAKMRFAEGTTPRGIRNWKLTKTETGQLFSVDLQMPIEGQALVTCQFHPRTTLSAQPSLNLPKAVSVNTTATYLGVRINNPMGDFAPNRLGSGMTALKWDLQNALDYPIDSLAKDFPVVPGWGIERKPLQRLYRQDKTGDLLVVPQLRTARLNLPTEEHRSWTLGPRAQVEGNLRWKSEDPALSVDFTLPTATLLVDLDSQDMQGWGRVGNRVRVWYKQPVRKPTVRWIGTWTGLPTNNRPFALPHPDKNRKGTVKVQGVDGWVAIPESYVRNPNRQPAYKRITNYAVTATAVPRFQLFEQATPAPIEILESLQSDESTLIHQTHFLTAVAPNRPHHFVLEMGECETLGDVELTLPPGTFASETTGQNAHRRWDVNVLTCPTGKLKLQLKSRLLSLGDGKLPTVHLLPGGMPAAKVIRRLHLPANEFRLVRTPAMQPLSDPDWQLCSEEVAQVVAVKPEKETPVTSAPPASQDEVTHTVTVPTAPREMPSFHSLVWGVFSLALFLWHFRAPWTLWPEQLSCYGLIAAMLAGPTLLGFCLVGLFFRGQLLFLWMRERVLATR